MLKKFRFWAVSKTTTPKFTPKAHFHEKIRQKKFFWRKFFTLPLHLQTSSPQYRPAFYRPSKSNPFSGGFHSDISASHTISSSGKSVKHSPGKNKEQQNEYTVPLKKSPQAMRRLRRFVRRLQFGYFRFHIQIKTQRSGFGFGKSHSRMGAW